MTPTTTVRADPSTTPILSAGSGVQRKASDGLGLRGMGGLDVQLAALAPRENAALQAKGRPGGAAGSQEGEDEQGEAAGQKAGARGDNRTFQTVSNIMKSRHEIAKSTIGNVR